MVIIINRSLLTAALANRNVNPNHSNNIRSTGGILSVTPFITATKLGKVTACNITTAISSNVLATVSNIFCWNRSLNVLNLEVKLCIFSAFPYTLSGVEYVSPDLCYFLESPTRINIICVIV